MREFKVRAADLNQAGADITYVNHDKDLDQAKKDSVLIAAAPELLAELENLSAVMACHDKTPEETLALEAAKKAIAKARGESS